MELARLDQPKTPVTHRRHRRSYSPLWLLVTLVLLLLLFLVNRKRTDGLLHTLSSYNKGNVISLSFSPDGKVLACATNILLDSNSTNTGSSWQETEVQLWDMQTATLLRTLKGRSGDLKCIAFSPNGRVIAGGSNGKTPFDTESMTSNPTSDNRFSIRLWDVRSGALLRVIPGTRAAIHTLTFLPNRCLLVLNSLANRVSLNMTHEPGQIKRMIQIKDLDTIHAVALSPDGRVIACSTWERKEVPIIHLWNAQTGQLLHTLRGHTDMVPRLAFSTDGRMLASGVASQTQNAAEIKIWKVGSGQLITTLNGNTVQVSSLAFSPDNKTLVNGSSDGTLKLWNVPGGQLRNTINSGMQMDALAFTQDGKALAGGGADTTIKIWNIS